MTSRKSSGSIPVESAVDPTRSQNITVNWRRSASGAAASAAGAAGLSACRKAGNGVRQRHGLGSGHAPIGRPDEHLALDIRRHPLDDDQLATQFFETVVIETKAELNPAMGDAALGDETPEDLLQHRSKFMLPSRSPRPSSLVDVLPPPGRY